MRFVVRRVVVPAAAMLAGIVAVFYGAKYHSAPVAQQDVEEQEQWEEVVKTIPFPTPFGRGETPPPAGEPTPGGTGEGTVPPDGPTPGGEPANPEGPQPPQAPPWAAGPESQPPGIQVTETRKVTRSVPVTTVHDVLEPELVREVTVGGVVLESGELRRTYSGGEPPPSLCPT
jgi:hypothetical protein